MAQYQNPQHDPDSEKRMLTMFLLIMCFLIFSEFYFSKRTQPPQKQNTEQGSGTSAGAVSTPAGSGTAVAEATPAAPVAASAKHATKQAAQQSEFVIENKVYKITFTNRGAQVTHWILKDYKDQWGKPLDLVNRPWRNCETCQQQADAAAQFGGPLSLYTYDQGLRSKLNQALYIANPQNAEIEVPGTLTFEYADGDVSVRKSFTFDPQSYLIKADVTITQRGAPVAAFLAWPAGFGDETTSATYLGAKIEYAPGEKVERTPAKKVSGGNTVHGPFYWAGAGDQYFAAVMLPDDLQSAAMVELSESIQIPKNLEHPNPKETETVPVLGAAVGSLDGSFKTRVFAGPKNLEVLNSIRTSPAAGETSGPSLGNLVDFGTFSLISKPIFMWLRWTQEHWTRNWGWAILVLTIIINAVVLPLRLPTMRSQLKMLKIQPEITAIKEKYKKYKFGDPKKQEEGMEIMALQKREGVNMFAGCIPMLLQLPFLYAFYAVLGNTIELRQAHWMWVPDLSMPDPYHLLPILFIGTMFITQRLSPSPGVDPAQQKMMMIMMPVMLGVFTWNYAAGLSLYWAGSNLIQIGQQYALNQTKLGKETRALMAKRARKKQGK